MNPWMGNFIPDQIRCHKSGVITVAGSQWNISLLLSNCEQMGMVYACACILNRGIVSVTDGSWFVDWSAQTGT